MLLPTRIRTLIPYVVINSRWRLLATCSECNQFVSVWIHPLIFYLKDTILSARPVMTSCGRKFFSPYSSLYISVTHCIQSWTNSLVFTLSEAPYLKICIQHSQCDNWHNLIKLDLWRTFFLNVPDMCRIFFETCSYGHIRSQLLKVKMLILTVIINNDFRLTG